MSKSRSRKKPVDPEENAGAAAPARSAAPKKAEMKLKGIKEPVAVTGVKDTGKAIHTYFKHPDDGTLRRVIHLK